MKVWGVFVALVTVSAGSSAQAATPCPTASLSVTGGLTVTTECIGEFGKFEGQPQTEWLDDGRTMRLLKSFTYVDPNNKRWTAPKDSTIDGASIPQFLWSLVGGPFEGQYRNASVVHDTECEAKQRDWRSVHEMFYYGTRAGGVGLVKGKLMYWAVYHCGPRWDDPKPICEKVKETQIRALVWLWRNMFAPLDQLRALTRAELEKQIPDGHPDFVKANDLLEKRESQRLAALTSGDAQRLAQIDTELFPNEASTAPLR
jgi:uncharacterized protein DUF1353